MNKRNILRLLAVSLLGFVMLFSLTLTAFAYADADEQTQPVTEASLPENLIDIQPKDGNTKLPESEPVDDEGNAHTRDLLYDKATNKQFITIQTKNGNTFFIIIDYDAPINDEEEQYQTYFLNMVDEADLLALTDEAAVEPLAACNCKDKCVVGNIHTECPLCRKNMNECAGISPQAEPPVESNKAEQSDDSEKPEKSSNMGLIIGVIAVVGIGGAAYYYFKFVRGRKQKDDDLDFFDDEGYEEEPYINEDAESEIANDEEETESEE